MGAVSIPSPPEISLIQYYIAIPRRKRATYVDDFGLGRWVGCPVARDIASISARKPLLPNWLTCQRQQALYRRDDYHFRHDW
ncbi:hypothetical protein PSENEW3n2_00000923 [Picochlorum sp. SENEW3]|nr:hypothetical protein PSENEW3n2_00000923 [Picochlorum sp. SENEW3]WPT14979.1 hypothetical protein PSENEW3_00000923 [Picochlorum sp. SENEW3]